VKHPLDLVNRIHSLVVPSSFVGVNEFFRWLLPDLTHCCLLRKVFLFIRCSYIFLSQKTFRTQNCSAPSNDQSNMAARITLNMPCAAGNTELTVEIPVGDHGAIEAVFSQIKSLMVRSLAVYAQTSYCILANEQDVGHEHY